MNEEQLSHVVIGAAIGVHRRLGPGLLESTYEACLCYDLVEQGVSIERQKPLPIIYKGINLHCGYRIDIMVDRKLIVELKAIQMLAPIHEAQMLTHLKLSGCTLGLIINFNVPILKDGVKRIVNRFDESTSRSWRLGGKSLP